MNYFDNSNIKLDILKKKAYNLRWAEVADGTIPLTAADMDYPCAPAIKQALLAYVEEGYFSYTPKLGLPAFNQAFSNYVKEQRGGNQSGAGTGGRQCSKSDVHRGEGFFEAWR